MAQSEARNERRPGVGRVLWASRGRILASTAALGFAAFLAGSLVPPQHRVSVHILSQPERSATLDEATLREIVRSLPGESRPERRGVIEAWASLIERSAVVQPHLGAERLADGSIVAWVEDADLGTARSRAQALGTVIIDRLAPVRAAVVSPPAPAPAPVATQPPGTLDALRGSLAQARQTLSTAEERLSAARTGAQGAGDRAPPATNGSRRAADAVRRELAGLERYARDLARASPADAPSSVRDTDEWSAWRAAVARRDALAAQMTELSRTLLDGHPRMATVRLRFADLERDATDARGRVSAVLDRRIASLRREAARYDREAADAAAADARDEGRRAALRDAGAQATAARASVQALEAALAAAETASASQSAAPAPAPAPATATATAPEAARPPAPVQSVLSESEQRPDIWPIVAGSAAFGFLASSLYSVLGARRRPAPSDDVSEPLVRGRRRGASRPEGAGAPERRSGSRRFDIAAADELIGGILASEVTRVVLVAIGTDDRPAAVEIVRRLALRGRQVALVDLSERQLAARALGVPPESLGIADMIAGDATFAEIARKDFATQAEAFGTGRATVGEANFLAMERRNVLEFVERNYEVVLLVCDGLPLDTVKSLLTPEAALVGTVDSEDEAAIEAGVKRLRDAGLDDMILADGRQFAS